MISHLLHQERRTLLGIEKKPLIRLIKHSPSVNCVTVLASNRVDDTTEARLCSSHFSEEDWASHKGSYGQ